MILINYIDGARCTDEIINLMVASLPNLKKLEYFALNHNAFDNLEVLRNGLIENGFIKKSETKVLTGYTRMKSSDKQKAVKQKKEKIVEI